MTVPFAAFSFSIHISMHDGGPTVQAAFAECSGLEVTLKPFEAREGGSAARQIYLPGTVSYGQLTLKRGMSADTGLWDWFEQAYSAALDSPNKLKRSDVAVVVRSTDGKASASYVLFNCHPVRLKAPALDAAKGGIAIEELQLAYEWLQRRR